MNAEAIYNMELHESIDLGYTDGCKKSVMRVPGGWIYEMTNIATKHMSQVFVPYEKKGV